MLCWNIISLIRKGIIKGINYFKNIDKKEMTEEERNFKNIFNTVMIVFSVIGIYLSINLLFYIW